MANIWADDNPTGWGKPRSALALTDHVRGQVFDWRFHSTLQQMDGGW
jgi:hypothetical protein